VQKAIELLQNGGFCLTSDSVGVFNEKCAKCVREYSNYVAARVLLRWLKKSHAEECFDQISAFLYT
jgi:hypothetical protein